MFFHIDESGNTGNNLFDENQPILSYGVLSSKTNVDVVGQQIHRKMLGILGKDNIHANVLGVSELTKVSGLLIQLHKKMQFKFDYYFIDKMDYALTMFFDSVFDAGLNPAVKWDTYWTPLRYLFIYKLSYLFDEKSLRDSWELCLHKNIKEKSDDISRLLETILYRAINNDFLDDRSKELMHDALLYGVNNPLKLDFGRDDPKMISPNAVCFQFVITSMARRIRQAKKKDANRIVVDRQSQFNKSQEKTLLYASIMSEAIQKVEGKEKDIRKFHPLYRDLDENDILGVGVPQRKITISDSSQSVGLQIVDVYLWIANRLLQGKELSGELQHVGSVFFKSTLIDGISIQGMLNRFKEFEEKLPALNALTKEQFAMYFEKVDQHREKVKRLF